jgi:hypothetical protein
MPTYDAAAHWNRSHPPGTPVVVRLADGRRVTDCTAGEALQWGSAALVTLVARPGMWMTTMLEPASHAASAGAILTGGG